MSEPALRVEPGSSEEALLRQIDRSRMPRHVAIIMDGNGRWAGKRLLPRIEGHRAGVSAVRETVESAARLGIEVLTLYAFSIENWKRPRHEVWTLMNLLKEFLRREIRTLVDNDIRLHILGRSRNAATNLIGFLLFLAVSTGVTLHGGVRLLLHLRAPRPHLPRADVRPREAHEDPKHERRFVAKQAEQREQAHHPRSDDEHDSPDPLCKAAHVRLRYVRSSPPGQLTFTDRSR